jgi:polysaccharide export outer membrane protein
MSGADSLLLPQPRYILGPGDQLRITFLGEGALDTDAKVTPDGRLLLPLIDEPILASGLSLDELKVEVESRLARYMVDPQTFIHLVELGSQHVFVLGEVRNPMLASAEPLTLAGALAACGGLTRDAQKKQIIVIRRHTGGDAQVFEVDFAKLLEGKSLLPDLQLQRYDIVVVPKSRVANLRDFMMAAFGNNIYMLRFGLDGVLLHNALQKELELYYQN